MKSQANQKLFSELENRYKNIESKIDNINLNNQYINASKKKFREFSSKEFEKETYDWITNVAINSWKEMQNKDINRNFFDIMAFEYGIQSLPPYSASSYVISVNKESRIEKMEMWGPGILLKPFIICKPFHIEEIGLEEYDKPEHNLYNTEYGNAVDILESMASIMCYISLHKVFELIDKDGGFNWLKIKKNGEFIIFEHDLGLDLPFYYKS